MKKLFFQIHINLHQRHTRIIYLLNTLETFVHRRLTCRTPHRTWTRYDRNLVLRVSTIYAAWSPTVVVLFRDRFARFSPYARISIRTWKRTKKRRTNLARPFALVSPQNTDYINLSHVRSLIHARSSWWKYIDFSKQ